MVSLIISSFITNFIFLQSGKVYNKLINKDEEDECIFLYGAIFISFLSLLINFFLPLNFTVNTIVYIIIFLLSFYLKLFLNKKDFFYLIIISIISISLVLFDTVYRPDAGLYHIPYIKIINSEKIIFGLSNLHSRFGHISIMQYLSAINNNLIFNNGISIALGSFCSFFIIFFMRRVYSIKNKKINISDIFAIFVLVYIMYKVIRFGEYGNDAPAHLISFFIIFKLLEKQRINFNKFKNLYLISIFAFLIKFSKIFLLIFPAILFFKNKYKFKPTVISLPTIFLVLWMLKNIITTSCIIYPIKNTCIQSGWLNNYQIEKASLEAEAWSKDWPNRIDRNISMKKYISEFNWLQSWLKTHFVIFIKLLIPYIFVCLILIMYLKNFKGVNLVNKENKFNIKMIAFVSLISTSFFLIKYPIYRYGYSELITLIIIFLMTLNPRYSTKNIKKISKNLFILFLLIFSIKQTEKYINYYNQRPANPQIMYNDVKFINYNFKKIYVNAKEFIYVSKNVECKYNYNLCTPYKPNKIDIKNYYSYKFIVKK